MSRFSEDLLAQAKDLAFKEKKRPRQASLRRAVSSAYYSLFHLLLDEAAALVAGAGPLKSKTDLRRLVGRSFTHTGIKSACVEMLKTTPADILKPFWLTLEIPQRIEMKRLAESFLESQQERHRADYDLSHSFTRAEVLVVLERVEQAITDWETVKKQHPKVAQFFALAMIMMESWRRR